VRLFRLADPAGDYGDGRESYSQCFACWAEDLNGDGYPDVVSCNWWSDQLAWWENPRGQDKPTTSIWPYPPELLILR